MKNLPAESDKAITQLFNGWVRTLEEISGDDLELFFDCAITVSEIHNKPLFVEFAIFHWLLSKAGEAASLVNKKTHSVYFIKSESGLTKVGYTSRNPETRFKQIKGMNHEHISLQFAWSDVEQSTETILHSMLKPYRVKNEWFKSEACDVVVQAIVEGMTQEMHYKEVYQYAKQKVEAFAVICQPEPLKLAAC